MDVSSLRSKCSFIDQKPIFTRGTIIEHIKSNAKLNWFTDLDKHLKRTLANEL